MGFFSWFKATPSNVSVLKDVIWLSRQARFKGIKKSVSEGFAEQDAPHRTLLVAHFRDTLDELHQIAEAVGSSDDITVASASSLRDNSALKMSFEESQPIEILVGERHPLLSRDESIMEFAASL